ncbi:hypothetical protein [Streptomyces cinerochromogenes]|uniref:hypothetical protein n=1 Tax=Streptomyces cinerochromogenes TaxID=66422 RepID=UPI0016704C90|nr:hypothetical protein [Streptomyces cinerochromogenes]GGS69858.1 hypothetical protein GCM10010206_35190 [Streptomyces cinerochromogenes]
MDTNEEPVPLKRLDLRREVVGDLIDAVLTTQGHSLWTCDIDDETAHEDDRDEAGSGTPRTVG